MIKKILKVLLIFLISISILNVPKTSYAIEEVETNSIIKISDEDTIGGKKKKKSTDIDDDLGTLEDYQSKTGDIGTLGDKASIVVGIIRTIGTVVSVIALIAIGIKYMLGSVEEKANYKKTLVPYLVGAILVFTVSWLPQIIYDIMKQFEK